MYNNDLNAMFEEDENRKFENWGKNEIAFFDDLEESEKEQLKKDYKDANTWKETYTSTMSRAMNSSSGIDYSTDIEKAGERMVNSKNKLDKTLSTLSEKHGSVRNK